MGNGFSNGNNVYVQLDKPYYSPGDVVNGQVLLNCIKPFEARAIVLKVEGYEKAMWTEHWTESTPQGMNNAHTATCHNPGHTQGGMHTHEVMEHRSGMREFFKIKIPLYSYPHTVQPGQYQFPFSCVLPTNLPGSFEITGHTGQSATAGHRCTNVRAKIRYKVKAECEVPGMFKANIRFKQHIMLYERMARPPSQIIQQDQKHVKACCCCSKGFVFITAHVEKDQYFPGEMASAIVEIDNQSTVDFNAVALELTAYLKLTSASGHRCEEKQKIHSCSLPGVRQGEQQLKENARRVSLPLPAQLLSTTSGQLVSYQYKLVVRLKGPMSVSDPTVKLPITIYQGVPQYVTYSAPPPYWAPTVMGTPVQVPMPSAPPIPPAQEAMAKPGYEQPSRAYKPSNPGYTLQDQQQGVIPAHQPAMVYGQPQPAYPAPQPPQYASQPLYQQPSPYMPSPALGQQQQQQQYGQQPQHPTRY